GPFADLLAQRYALAIKRLGLNKQGGFALDCDAFCPPGGQMSLL
ncbi:radical SAM protein, partial [Pseudomonas syringae]|nr:radical SAM protein [Pseudomonas syringae]